MLFHSRRANAILMSMAIAGCAGDGPVDPVPVHCSGPSADLTTLAVYQAATVHGDQLECVRLAADADYILLPQFLGESMPYVLHPYLIGPTDAPIVAARALTDEAAALRAPSTAERLHDLIRRHESRFDASPASAKRQTPSAKLQTALPDITSRGFSVLATLQEPLRFDSVPATLRFSGDNVLLYLDDRVATAYDEAELAAFGALFDDVLHPVDRAAFGAESDIDGNGRLIMLVTPTVNALVSASACATQGFATGFFYGFDLAGAPPQSNRGEIFYAMSPDPSGTYSCPHTKSDVAALLPTTFAHELQHMISYGQRVVARGQSPELPWLNEGLSHIAEELAAAHFEARYPPPSGRSDPTQIFPDSAGPFIIGDLFNSYRFLRFSEQYSVSTCAPGSFCFTPERGGAWLFLRWLRDATNDPQLFSKLLQSSEQGRANVAAAAGRSFQDLFGDFAIAVWGDSIVGSPRASVAAPRRFATRNLRQLYSALYFTYGISRGIPQPFPITPIALDVDERVESVMRPGTFQAFSVRTPEGAEVAIALTSDAGSPLSPAHAAQLSILRVPRP